MPTKVPFSLVAIVTLIALATVGYIGYSYYQERPAHMAPAVFGSNPATSTPGTSDTAASSSTPASAAQLGIDTAPASGASIVGTWQNTTDAKFTRTIYENGGYLDTYQGQPQATSNGPWSTFTSATAPKDFPYTLEKGATYLQLGGTSTDTTLYFKVSHVSTTTLQLIYLNRGGALNFTRVSK